MQSKIIYLGRLTVGAGGIATGAAQDLTGGEATPSLVGWTLARLTVQTKTAPTITGSATMQIRTGNNTAASAAFTPSNPSTDALVATKHITMASGDLAAAWDVVIGGSSTSLDSGVLDVFGEFIAPRA